MHDFFKELRTYFDPVENRKSVQKIIWETLEKKHGDIEEIVSDCCGSKIINEDRCKECKENAVKVYHFADGFSCDEDGTPIY